LLISRMIIVANGPFAETDPFRLKIPLRVESAPAIVVGRCGVRRSSAQFRGWKFSRGLMVISIGRHLGRPTNREVGLVGRVSRGDT